MLWVLNAFSLNMVGEEGRITFRRVSPERARALLESVPEWKSAIGHAETAAIVSGLLGLEVPMNRATVQLLPGDEALVAQYRGPRLPEGATRLPEGAEIAFYYVFVEGEEGMEWL